MVPLHTLSNYSFLRGVLPVDDLVRLAKSWGYPALALTDIESTHGHIPFIKACRKQGIKPLLGATFLFGEEADAYVLVVAKNNTGYSDLCRLITQKKLSSLSVPELGRLRKQGNLFFVTPSYILYHELEGEQTFLEIPLHKRLKARLPDSLFHAKDHNIQAVITNPIVFGEQSDWILHKVVSAIRERRVLDNLPETCLSDEANYFLDPSYIQKRFKEYETFLTNSDCIADKCSETCIELGKFKFPVSPDLPGGNTHHLLMQKCFESLWQKYPGCDERYSRRLDEELSVIDTMGFTDYFLVVWDIVREARRRGMLLLGRGSVGNSLVANCLGFTDIDPIEQDLLFERFMNTSRLSPPDIDLDFSWRERDEIIKYIFEKYGYDRVAMISTTVTFRARSAFRETAKVFGFSNDQITPFAKLIPWTSAGNLERLPDLFPESKNLPFHEEPWKSIVRIASRLAGFPRHLSIHPSGIVISPQPITDYVALEFAKNKGLGLIITQPDMYSIEDLGLVKIDILSQRSLGVLRDTLQRLTSKK
jgi:DNA polymerase III alpha subunit